MRWLGIVRLMAGLGSLALALLMALAFYDRYWRWRGCFNELGRCWDTETEQVYLEQAGLVWGGFAGVFLLAGLVLLVRRRPRA